MDERDVVDRLEQFGEQPIKVGLTQQVLTAISTEQMSVRRRRTRMKVAGAAVAGFFVGSLGLASAGALPASLQDTAQSVLDRVGVHVPAGHDRYNDPTVCPDGPYRNHGEYVRTHHDDPHAGQSPCGKPTQAVDPGNASNSSDSSESDDATEESGAPGDQGEDHANSDASSSGASNSSHSDSSNDASTHSSDGSTHSSDGSTNSSNSSSGS